MKRSSTGFKPVHSKRKKVAKTASGAGQDQNMDQLDPIDDALDSVVSQSAVYTQCAANTNNVALLKKSISEMRSVIGQQQAVINKLTTRLEFVMSFLGINDPDQMNISHSKSTNPSNNAGGSLSWPLLQSTSNQQPAGSVDPSARSTNVSAASAAASGRSAQRPPNLIDNILSAVYADKNEKERRAKSVVVTGLADQSNVTDKDLFHNICSSQFGIDLQIINCKRLGSTVEGRIQPLLVMLPSAQTASELVTMSKSLSRSTNVSLRSMYINHNLTRAEARSAYELRCQRRTAAQRRQEQQQQQEQAQQAQQQVQQQQSQQLPDNINGDNTTNHSTQSVGNTSTQSSSSTSNLHNAPGCQLRPSAAEFQPAA